MTDIYWPLVVAKIGTGFLALSLSIGAYTIIKWSGALINDIKRNGWRLEW